MGLLFRFDPKALRRLEERLREILELFTATRYQPYRLAPRQLSAHVWELTNTSARSYVVIDDAGAALMIDAGYCGGMPIAGGLHRWIDHLSEFLAQVGIKTVEWLIPTHYHDDHLAGYPFLQQRFGTRIATAADVQEVFDGGTGFGMPCLMPVDMPVSAAVGRNQPFHWGSIDFHIRSAPGQTVYDTHICFEVDATRYLAVGDAVTGRSFREQIHYIHSFIPHNRVPVSAYAGIPGAIAAWKADVLLTGHGGAVPCDQTMLAEWGAWMKRWAGLFSQVVVGSPDRAMDPGWAQLRPARRRVRPEDVVELVLVVTNHEEQPLALRGRFSAGAEVHLLPDRFEREAEARGETRIPVTATVSGVGRFHSVLVTAEVILGDTDYGPVAQSVLYW